jgi:hypothetical protein
MGTSCGVSRDVERRLPPSAECGMVRADGGGQLEKTPVFYIEKKKRRRRSSAGCRSHEIINSD